MYLKEKENLIKVVKDKLSMSEKELAHSSSAINKFPNGSQMLNEIINSSKSFSDKWGIEYDEGIFTLTTTIPKFVKSTIQEPKFC